MNWNLLMYQSIRSVVAGAACVVVKQNQSEICKVMKAA